MAPFSWREELRKRSGVVPQFTLPRAQTALVIVDMQNVTSTRGFGADALFANDPSPYSSYYFDRIEQFAIPNCARLLQAFRRAGLRVIHLTVGSFLPDGSDFEPLRMSFDVVLLREGRVKRRVIAAAGTDDHEIIRALAPRPDEIALNKVTRSAFSSTGLDQILRNLGVAGLVMVGTTTNACVGLTACDAGDRGYKVVIVEDATAAPTPVLHEATLLNFAFLFGHVRTTEEVLADLGLVDQDVAQTRR
jgi:nicotinamidase-related amidase